MESKGRLIKNTAIIAMGKCSTQILTFLLLPLYTAILTSYEYGTYDYINSLVLFLVPFTTILMEEAMFRFLIDADTDEKKKEIISQSVIFIIGSLILVSVILYVIFFISKNKLKIYIVLYFVASIYNSLAQSFARGIGEIKIYAIGSFISSSLTLVLNVVFIVVFRMSVKGLLLSFIIANIFTPTFIILKLKMYKYISLKEINKNQMAQMLKYSIPLVPNSVSWIIINLSDRLIIMPVLGAAANGIYAIANKFPGMINTIYGYFYTAWKEEASRAIKDDNYEEYYNSIYRDLKRILYCISIGLLAILPFIFDVLIDCKFSEAYQYIPLLIIGVYFSNISGFYGGIFTAKKDTKIMGISTIISAIINLSITILLINKLGIYAAVLSTFISNLVVCFYRSYKLREYIIFEKDDMFYLTALILLMGVILSYSYNNLWINSITLLVVLIYCIYINKNILIKIYEMIRRVK